MSIDEDKIAEALEQTGSTIAALVRLIKTQQSHLEKLEERLSKLEDATVYRGKR